MQIKHDYPEHSVMMYIIDLTAKTETVKRNEFVMITTEEWVITGSSESIWIPPAELYTQSQLLVYMKVGTAAFQGESSEAAGSHWGFIIA